MRKLFENEHLDTKQENLQFSITFSYAIIFLNFKTLQKLELRMIINCQIFLMNFSWARLHLMEIDFPLTRLYGISFPTYSFYVKIFLKWINAVSCHQSILLLSNICLGQISFLTFCWLGLRRHRIYRIRHYSNRKVMDWKRNHWRLDINSRNVTQSCRYRMHRKCVRTSTITSIIIEWRRIFLCYERFNIFLSRYVWWLQN